MKNLYVSRKLHKPEAFHRWAARQGFKTLVAVPHVTIAYSSKEVDWSKFTPDEKPMLVHASIFRELKAFGEDKKSIVMAFKSKPLQARWKQFIDGGCSWDYPEYQPHLSITYEGYEGKLSNRLPWYAGFELEKEVFEEIDDE